MKKFTVTIFFALLLCARGFIPALHAAGGASTQQQFDEKQERLLRAADYASDVWAQKHHRLPRAEKRWSLFGRVGYAYDDNVPLASSHKEFRTGSEDTSAGRYLTENGFAYELIRKEKTRVEVQYTFYQSLHDDGLNNYNFENHEVVLRAVRQLNWGPRPSEVSLEYAFSLGFLKAESYSSFNTWTARWKSSWRDEWPVEIYQAASERNYRDHGFQPSDTSRNGYYSRTGIIQGYRIKSLNALVYAGYEFAFDATRGNNFDNLANGLQFGWRSPLIEKVRIDLNAYFQDAVFNHYSGTPDRHDFKTQYEARLARPFGKYFELQVFYRRTDVNTAHDGVLGLFNYERNMYGAEWHYRF